MTSATAIVFSLFILLFVANLVFLASKRRLRFIPFTALLVIAGVALGLLVKVVPALSFVTEFKLTPDLLFYVFLPVLIFESAYNFQIRKFYENIVAISLLSTIGLFISTFAIGFGLQFVFGLLGISAPLVYFLLFGALISATDPIAALSLFKSSGAPQRLSLIFEGESLFNDGTAVSLFVILLAVLAGGAEVTVGSGAIAFISMVFGGVIFGLILGRLFSYLLTFSARYEKATLAIMLVMAHIVFLGSEVFNELFREAGFLLQISPIIATTIASLELGNNGRFHLSPRAGHFIEKYWEQLAFMVNSLVFLLVGILTVDSNLWTVDIIVPAAIVVVVVTLARFISVYPTLGLLNVLKIEAPVQPRWIKMLSWGGLRGALAIIIVLTVPDTLSIPGWTYNISPKDFLLMLTLVTVLSSLVIKTASIKSVMNRLGIFNLGMEDDLRVKQSISFLASLKLEKLERSFEKGYVDEKTYQKLSSELRLSIESVSGTSDNELFKIMLQSYAVGIERYFLQEIYAREEVTERVYRRILLKLEIQQEKIKQKKRELKHLADHTLATALVADRMDKVRAKLARNASKNFTTAEQFMYFRALAIIARKAVKEIGNKTFTCGENCVVDEVVAHYQAHVDENNAHVERLQNEYPEVTARTSEELARKQLRDFGADILERLKKTDFISSRVHTIVNKKVSEK